MISSLVKVFSFYKGVPCSNVWDHCCFCLQAFVLEDTVVWEEKHQLFLEINSIWVPTTER